MSVTIHDAAAVAALASTTGVEVEVRDGSFPAAEHTFR